MRPVEMKISSYPTTYEDYSRNNHPSIYQKLTTKYIYSSAEQNGFSSLL
jgi:hypothetical protein